MSDELSAAEKVVEEVLIDLMTERVMSERGLSTGVQASSMRGPQASPSTAQPVHLEPTDEKEPSTGMTSQMPSLSHAFYLLTYHL
jgi:hypothetical protein